MDFGATKDGRQTYTVRESPVLKHIDGNDARKGTSSGVDTAASQGATEFSPLLDTLVQPAAQPSADEIEEDERWEGDEDFDGLPWWKTPSIWWLIVPFMLYTFAWGGIIVPKLNLIVKLECRSYLSSQQGGIHVSVSALRPNDGSPDLAQCQAIPEVQSAVAHFTLYISIIAGVLSAFSSPQMGIMSDRYGRKGQLALTSLGTVLSELVFLFAAKYPESFSMYWILVGSAFEGIFGSFVAAIAISNAYVADCYAPKDRNVKFGYLYGVLCIGIALGPLISGYIVEATGQLITMIYIALALHVGYILFLLICTPESVSKRRQHMAREKRKTLDLLAGAPSWAKRAKALNPFAPLKILFPTGPGTSNKLRANLVFLATTDSIVFGIGAGAASILMLYAEYSFHWSNLDTSKFIAIVNGGRVIGLFVLLPLVTWFVRSRKGMKKQRLSGSDKFDLYLIRIAVLFDTLGYIGYTLAKKGSVFTLSGVVASFGAVGSPAISSALTKHVPVDRTGQVLGATGLLHCVMRVVAPTVFNLIYAHTVGSFDQAVLVCLAATFGFAFIVSWFIRPHVYYDEPIAKPSSDEETPSTDS